MTELFRFSVLRQPESVRADGLRLPTLETMELTDSGARIALELEAAVEGGSIAAVQEQHHLSNEQTLSLALRFSDKLSVINTLANTLGDGQPVIIGNLSEVMEQSVMPTRQAHFGPVGVADLYVVEEELAGYEMSEISYIESVLKSEKRTRTHSVTTVTESRALNTSEVSTFQEDNLQASDRLSLRSAARAEVNRRSQFTAGLEVSAKYGPTVEAKASMNLELESSRQAASERASEFSREIVESSVSRTEEKVRNEREDKTSRTTEHVNLHEFDNISGDQNIVGLYRYVDKVVTLRQYNRGPRFFFEFLLPEPGAYLRALDTNPPVALSGKAPKAPTETPQSITPENYASLLRKYSLSGIKPPPTGRIVLTETFGDIDTGASGGQRLSQQGAFAIDDGYMAIEAMVKVTAFAQHNIDPEVWVTVGDTTRHRANGWPGLNGAPLANDGFGRFPLNNQRRSLSYQVYARHDSTVQVAIEVTCEPTPEAILHWQHEVYSAIQDRYQEQLSEYEEEKAFGNFDGSLLDDDAPAAVLRDREIVELKRQSLQILGQWGKKVDPLNEGDLPLVAEIGEDPLEEGGRNLIDTDRLDELSPQLRFGEQAFEWEEMQFVLYPYYWSDPRKWRELATLEHPDTRHQDFLRAGAARVLVPARDAFLDMLLGYLQVGVRALDSLETVKITDSEWLPIIEEIRAARGANKGSGVLTDCWQERIPTTLTILDTASSLPTPTMPEDCGTSSDDEQENAPLLPDTNLTDTH